MELTELAETVNEILQKQENEPESENKESGANKWPKEFILFPIFSGFFSLLSSLWPCFYGNHFLI